ncbi:Crp/Fnr family transcriptional regulator [Noviherbaspirillum malthae]|uniref:Crp/Fnr family transcriptional regulator n=1 Tax=Noviherbaspirillum malthae TaxID=1260987 RepID=UPI00188F1F59|nr:Crp/Fnr family transcriptional regulator [Noviherbaspirillum malthae]
MSVTLSEARLYANHLLAKLSDEHLAPLCPLLERVHTRPKEILHTQHAPIQYVYFPSSGALSNLVFLNDGSAIEVGTVGNEGCSAIELVAGASVANETTVCQIEGVSLRITVGDFRKTIQGPTPLRHVTESYLQAYLAQLSQSVACNRKHSLEARFARWLLLTHDRVQGREFLLTQEFLADMLGVHRPSVSLVASGFQKMGIIEYKRGQMKILNRAALEHESCECYAMVRDQFKRVLNVPYG